MINNNYVKRKSTVTYTSHITLSADRTGDLVLQNSQKYHFSSLAHCMYLINVEAIQITCNTSLIDFRISQYILKPFQYQGNIFLLNLRNCIIFLSALN